MWLVGHHCEWVFDIRSSTLSLPPIDLFGVQGVIGNLSCVAVLRYYYIQDVSIGVRFAMFNVIGYADST